LKEWLHSVLLPLADGARVIAGGKAFYSPSTGANVVTGQVLAKYQSVGGPLGDLGFPTSSEADGGLAPASRISTFAAPDKPVIFWTPDYGAVIVRGAMNAAWAKLGGAPGPLGAPIADQTESANVITQRFSGGEVSWNKATNKFSTQPPNLASALSGLQVPGYQPPNAPKSSPASKTNGDRWFAYRSWYLLIIASVLVLLAAALVSGALLRRRRRRRDGARVSDDAFAAGERDPAPIADHHVAEAHSPTFGYREDEQFFAPLGAPGFHAETWDTTTEDDPTPTGDVPGAGENEDAVGSPYDSDAVDTVPTPIASDDEPHTGRHAAVELDEPESTRPAIHLPLDDPHRAPEGYPIKADTKSGRYWAPSSGRYDNAIAEIWFASEEFARANWCVKGE